MGKNEKAFAITMLCGIIGIVLAIIVQLLYEWEIIIDSVVTATITLREIQVVLIAGWLGLGIAISAIQR